MNLISILVVAGAALVAAPALAAPQCQADLVSPDGQLQLSFVADGRSYPEACEQAYNQCLQNQASSYPSSQCYVVGNQPGPRPGNRPPYPGYPGNPGNPPGHG